MKFCIFKDECAHSSPQFAKTALLLRSSFYHEITAVLRPRSLLPTSSENHYALLEGKGISTAVSATWISALLGNRIPLVHYKLENLEQPNVLYPWLDSSAASPHIADRSMRAYLVEPSFPQKNVSPAIVFSSFITIRINEFQPLKWLHKGRIMFITQMDINVSLYQAPWGEN
jgi:hypothetical protein